MACHDEMIGRHGADGIGDDGAVAECGKHTRRVCGQVFRKQGTKTRGKRFGGGAEAFFFGEPDFADIECQIGADFFAGSGFAGLIGHAERMDIEAVLAAVLRNQAGNFPAVLFMQLFECFLGKICSQGFGDVKITHRRSS